MAADKGYAEIIALLIEADAPLESKDKSSVSAVVGCGGKKASTHTHTHTHTHAHTHTHTWCITSSIEFFMVTNLFPLFICIITLHFACAHGIASH